MCFARSHDGHTHTIVGADGFPFFPLASASEHGFTTIELKSSDGNCGTTREFSSCANASAEGYPHSRLTLFRATSTPRRLRHFSPTRQTVRPPRFPNFRDSTTTKGLPTITPSTILLSTSPGRFLSRKGSMACRRRFWWVALAGNRPDAECATR